MSGGAGAPCSPRERPEGDRVQALARANLRTILGLTGTKMHPRNPKELVRLWAPEVRVAAAFPADHGHDSGRSFGDLFLHAWPRFFEPIVGSRLDCCSPEIFTLKVGQEQFQLTNPRVPPDPFLHQCDQATQVLRPPSRIENAPSGPREALASNDVVRVRVGRATGADQFFEYCSGFEDH
jgi:hypothetical protein